MTEQTEQIKRIVGKIIMLNPKGYGFIISNDLPFERVFFHWSALKQETKRFKDLKKNDVVEFTPIDYVDKETKKVKGFRALKIVVLENVSSE